ncbi:MAG: [protein-PII] uridylyltransferase [Myxococcales bacterium]|nr:[protein-PII] uridylyltransferase [Myxococcales bacterium]
MRSSPSIDPLLAELPRPVGRESREAVAAVRAYLAEVRGYLEALHREEKSGRVVNEANSDLTDRMVRRLFALAEESILLEGGEVDTGVAVVAVGGYARREMSIHSDVDLLVLYRDALTPYVAGIAERLLYWMWDAGLTVGCATRTIDETIALGREDETVRTGVLMARFLCGDGEFFHAFADSVRRELLPDVEAFLEERREGLAARHLRYGESLFLLQPNIKEGAGGLRDYHAAYWAARGAIPMARDIDDWLHFGLLTEHEMRELRGALDFLWRVRNELHLLTRRCSDQMSFEHQEQIAEALGYGSRADLPPVEEDPTAELPVERFMRDYYRQARAIQNYSELVLDLLRARVATAPREREVKATEDGFRLVDGHLEIPHAGHLREDPRRLLRAFRIAQEWGVPLSRTAQRLLRESLDLIDDDFRRDPACTALFMGILGAEQRVMRSLMAMNDIDLLGRYLPEWDHIVCRWQHVIYHTYTVDVHSIFLVEELRRLWRGKYEAALPALTRLVHEVEDLPALYLGCLLHDIGKGFGGDHSAKGVVLARRCLERLGLDAERAERVIFVVEHHLLMSHLAQRRDLSDAKMILEFAKLCGDRVNLRNLYLCTFADIRASSRDAWTDWKGDLLRELFERASEVLESGAEDPSQAMELIEARVEARREGAADELRALGVGEEKIASYFAGLPLRYFVAHTPRQIARHAQVVLRFRDEQVCIVSHREMKGGFTELIVCARDVHGLYAKIAGTITASDLNILGSHVYTMREGLALEVYRITTPEGGRDERRMRWGEFERALRSVLTGERDVSELLRRRRRRRMTLPPQPEAPTVLVSNLESDFYTVVDVSANDRIGLLFDLTRTLGDAGVEIFVSKAATIRDQVADTFYVKDADGKKLEGEACGRLREALLAAIAEGEAETRA